MIDANGKPSLDSNFLWCILTCSFSEKELANLAQSNILVVSLYYTVIEQRYSLKIMVSSVKRRGWFISH